MAANISVSRSTYDELVRALSTIGIRPNPATGKLWLEHLVLSIDLLAEGYSTIEVRVLNLVSEQYGVPVSELSPKTRLDSLGDSLDTIELMIALEDEFKIPTISALDADRLITVGDVFTVLKEYLHER